MSERLTLHMLPAADGDCLLVQAVTVDDVTTSMLIDGGRGDSAAIWLPVLERILGDRPVLDLLVVTHIDADHIGGIIEFLKQEPRKITVSQIWFNGYDQVKAALEPDARESFSVKQADALSKIVRSQTLPWNTSFDGGPIQSEPQSLHRSVGNLTIDVLTPSRRKLAAMAGPWDAALAEAAKKAADCKRTGLEALGGDAINVPALAAQADETDVAKPNGSSIGLMISAFGRSLLLTGDCHPDDLEEALAARQAGSMEPIRVDVLKVSHHGARTNTSKAVLAKIVADTYAFSTDASRHPHPERSAVAKTLMSNGSPKTLAFNYRTKLTEPWDEESLKASHGYATRYPSDGEAGYLRIDLVRDDERVGPNPP